MITFGLFNSSMRNSFATCGVVCLRSIAISATSSKPSRRNSVSCDSVFSMAFANAS